MIQDSYSYIWMKKEDVKALERNATWPLHAKLSGFQGSNG